jgi:hypothetical protein
LKPDERTIETFVGILPKEPLGAEQNGNNEIKGSFLPNNVKDISVSPDTSRIFYLFITGTSEENMIGTTLSFLNNRKVQIFDSPFTEWLSFWPSGNLITLSTKPSSSSPGYMYTMDSAGKNLTKVLGDVPGLITLTNPSGKTVLYSDSSLSLNLYNMDARNAILVPIRSLAEKCVWDKGGNFIYCAIPKQIGSGAYPDSWYQGEVSFNDEIWKIEAATGNTTLLANPASVPGGEEIDGVKLALDETESYLFFVNKKDSFLWKLDLK